MPGSRCNETHLPLRLSANRRFLVGANETPFFWMGDTAWGLLNLLDKPDTELYLRTRARQGFNVVQCVVLTPEDGFGEEPTRERTPLIDLDPLCPNTPYFEHLDWVVETAMRYGIVLAILPTWGENVQDRRPRIFKEETIRSYGRLLGRRYRTRQNIVWVLGGDRVPSGCETLWNALATGLGEGDGGRHPMTFHVSSEHSSSEFWPDADWLDFNMIQSGHPVGPFGPNYALVQADYEKTPTKPTLDGESLYEDMPMGFVPNNGRATAHHIRANAYWAVFAGACGHTYGHNSVWQMHTQRRPGLFWARGDWRDALEAEGAAQMTHLKNLILSRPYLTRIPDQNALSPAPISGASHVQLTRDGSRGRNDATYIMAYFPHVTWLSRIRTDVIASQRLRGWWYDPRTGDAHDIGVFENAGLFDLHWQTRLEEHWGGPDWVLVLDAADRAYPPPGRT